MVGGINSEIVRLMKISVRNLKLGRGEHTTQAKRVKYSCARKKKVLLVICYNTTNLNYFSHAAIRACWPDAGVLLPGLVGGSPLCFDLRQALLTTACGLFFLAVAGDGVLDYGVLTMLSPGQLDWAEDPHGRILMGQFGQLPHTWKIPQELVIKTRTPPHRRIRLGLLLS